MDPCCESTIYQAKQGNPRSDFSIKPKSEKKKKASGGGGIRCPKCRWTPRRFDTWMCHCRTVWNTFDTRGKCPGCGFQWTQTNCPACREWSPHEAWYEKDNPS
ncbi:MAG TPA: hypothetical protein VGL53_21220 [Bryobacteraceae bacterium]|jgi:hypothetical protein